MRTEESRLQLAYFKDGVAGLRRELSLGADPSEPGQLDMLILADVACRNDVEAIEVLLQAGVPVPRIGSRGAHSIRRLNKKTGLGIRKTKNMSGWPVYPRRA